MRKSFWSTFALMLVWSIATGAFLGCIAGSLWPEPRRVSEQQVLYPATRAVEHLDNAATAIDAAKPKAPAAQQELKTAGQEVSRAKGAVGDQVDETQKVLRVNTRLVSDNDDLRMKLNSQKIQAKFDQAELKRQHDIREKALEAEIYTWEHDNWLGGKAIIWRERIMAGLGVFVLSLLLVNHYTDWLLAFSTPFAWCISLASGLVKRVLSGLWKLVAGTIANVKQRIEAWRAGRMQ